MKLDPEYQKAMDEADEGREDGEFEALPDGAYLARIEKITLSSRAGASGYKQWVVVWRILRPSKYAKRTIWDRLSLSPAAAFKMREMFDALGFSYDSDSTELIGERAVLEIIQEEIDSGNRKGEMGNDVDAVRSAEDSEAMALVGK